MSQVREVLYIEKVTVSLRCMGPLHVVCSESLPKSIFLLRKYCDSVIPF